MYLLYTGVVRKESWNLTWVILGNFVGMQFAFITLLPNINKYIV